ncbi:MAG: IclR family transcriptional regulator [Chloroflexota bacterium]
MPRINPDSPKSVLAKVDSILQLFQADKPILTLADIVEETQVRKTTAHRLLQELADMGYLALVPEGYAPGLRLLELGMIAQQTLGLDEIMQEIVGDFMAEFNETVTLAALRGQEFVYMHVMQSSNPLQVVVLKGSHRPASFGATGIALLACLPEVERNQFAAAGLPAFTPHTIINPEAWLARLAEIERDGVAIEYNEYVLGLGAVALPIKRNQLYALTVFGPTERIQAREAEIVSSLLSLHNALMRQLPL